MGGLIGRIIADVAIDRATAEKAGGFIVDIQAEESPPDRVQLFFAKLPEAQARKTASEDGGGMGGVTGAAMRMMGAGLNIGGVQSVTHQFITYACEKVGEDAGGEFVAAIPAQFV